MHIVHEDAHGAEAEAEGVERREGVAEEHDGAQDAEELLGALGLGLGLDTGCRGAP